MYEPLYPSGSNRMIVKDIPDNPIYNFFAPSGNSDQAWMAFANKKSDSPPSQTPVAPTAQPPDPLKNNAPANPTTNAPENQTNKAVDDPNLVKALSGLNGKPCVDMYPECPEFKEHNYCKKYRKQMMFQCRKTCHFCDISPYNSVEQRGNFEDEEELEQPEEEASGDDQDEDSGSGDTEG
ncbi:hypothetical protein RF11_09655 [Thelohanellus kitauei]|uniref:ShKT domain-containing protein n=1 Tax=Thelohanellus kitauei TaxID=669202 RepID=A0A0C2NBN2_THEKT|nr:hypothetical protein RF11_09655 [Thelohanellus kitauei]